MQSSSLQMEFPFEVGEVVLAEWDHGKVYYAKIEEIDREKRVCKLLFDDDSVEEAPFSAIHSVTETTNEIVCIICKNGLSEYPNEIVLCDKCGLGFHQECHVPNIPESALEFDAPWMCVYCTEETVCPFIENPFEKKQQEERDSTTPEFDLGLLTESDSEAENSDDKADIHTRLRHRRRDPDTDRSRRTRIISQKSPDFVSQDSPDSLEFPEQSTKGKLKPTLKRDKTIFNTPDSNSEQTVKRSPESCSLRNYIKRSLSRDGAIKRPSKFLRQALSARSIAMYSHLASRKNATKRTSITHRGDSPCIVSRKTDHSLNKDTSSDNTDGSKADNGVVLTAGVSSTASNRYPTDRSHSLTSPDKSSTVPSHQQSQLKRSQSVPAGERKDPFQVGHISLQRMKFHSSFQQKTNAAVKMSGWNEKFLEKYKIPSFSKQSNSPNFFHGHGKEDLKKSEANTQLPGYEKSELSHRSVATPISSAQSNREDPLQVYLDKHKDMNKMKGAQTGSTKSVLPAARSASHPYKQRQSLTIEIQNKQTINNNSLYSKSQSNTSTTAVNNVISTSHKTKMEREIPLQKFLQRKQSASAVIEKDCQSVLAKMTNSTSNSNDDTATDLRVSEVKLVTENGTNSGLPQQNGNLDDPKTIQHFKKKFLIPQLESVSSTMPDKFLASDTDQSDEGQNEEDPANGNSSISKKDRELRQQAEENPPQPTSVCDPPKLLPNQYANEPTGTESKMPKLILIQKGYYENNDNQSEGKCQNEDEDVSSETVPQKDAYKSDGNEQKEYILGQMATSQDQKASTSKLSEQDKGVTDACHRKSNSEKIMTLEEHARIAQARVMEFKETSQKNNQNEHRKDRSSPACDYNDNKMEENLMETSTMMPLNHCLDKQASLESMGIEDGRCQKTPPMEGVQLLVSIPLHTIASKGNTTETTNNATADKSQLAGVFSHPSELNHIDDDKQNEIYVEQDRAVEGLLESENSNDLETKLNIDLTQLPETSNDFHSHKSIAQDKFENEISIDKKDREKTDSGEAGLSNSIDFKVQKVDKEKNSYQDMTVGLKETTLSDTNAVENTVDKNLPCVEEAFERITSDTNDQNALADLTNPQAAAQNLTKACKEGQESGATQTQHNVAIEQENTSTNDMNPKSYQPNQENRTSVVPSSKATVHRVTQKTAPLKLTLSAVKDKQKVDKTQSTVRKPTPILPKPMSMPVVTSCGVVQVSSQISTPHENPATVNPFLGNAVPVPLQQVQVSMIQTPVVQTLQSKTCETLPKGACSNNAAKSSKDSMKQQQQKSAVSKHKDAKTIEEGNLPVKQASQGRNYKNAMVKRWHLRSQSPDKNPFVRLGDSKLPESHKKPHEHTKKVGNKHDVASSSNREFKLRRRQEKMLQMGEQKEAKTVPDEEGTDHLQKHGKVLRNQRSCPNKKGNKVGNGSPKSEDGSAQVGKSTRQSGQDKSDDVNSSNDINDAETVQGNTTLSHVIDKLTRDMHDKHKSDLEQMNQEEQEQSHKSDTLDKPRPSEEGSEATKSVKLLPRRRRRIQKNEESSEKVAKSGDDAVDGDSSNDSLGADGETSNGSVGKCRRPKGWKRKNVEGSVGGVNKKLKMKHKESEDTSTAARLAQDLPRHNWLMAKHLKDKRNDSNKTTEDESQEVKPIPSQDQSQDDQDQSVPPKSMDTPDEYEFFDNETEGNPSSLQSSDVKSKDTESGRSVGDQLTQEREDAEEVIDQHEPCDFSMRALEPTQHNMEEQSIMSGSDAVSGDLTSGDTDHDVEGAVQPLDLSIKQAIGAEKELSGIVPQTSTNSRNAIEPLKHAKVLSSPPPLKKDPIMQSVNKTQVVTPEMSVGHRNTCLEPQGDIAKEVFKGTSVKGVGSDNTKDHTEVHFERMGSQSLKGNNIQGVPPVVKVLPQKKQTESDVKSHLEKEIKNVKVHVISDSPIPDNKVASSGSKEESAMNPNPMKSPVKSTAYPVMKSNGKHPIPCNSVPGNQSQSGVAMMTVQSVQQSSIPYINPHICGPKTFTPMLITHDMQPVNCTAPMRNNLGSGEHSAFKPPNEGKAVGGYVLQKDKECPCHGTVEPGTHPQTMADHIFQPSNKTAANIQQNLAPKHVKQQIRNTYGVSDCQMQQVYEQQVKEAVMKQQGAAVQPSQGIPPTHAEWLAIHSQKQQSALKRNEAHHKEQGIQSHMNKASSHSSLQRSQGFDAKANTPLTCESMPELRSNPNKRPGTGMRPTNEPVQKWPAVASRSEPAIPNTQKSNNHADIHKVFSTNTMPSRPISHYLEGRDDAFPPSSNQVCTHSKQQMTHGSSENVAVVESPRELMKQDLHSASHTINKVRNQSYYEAWSRSKSAELHEIQAKEYFIEQEFLHQKRELERLAAIGNFKEKEREELINQQKAKADLLRKMQCAREKIRLDRELLQNYEKQRMQTGSEVGRREQQEKVLPVDGAHMQQHNVQTQFQRDAAAKLLNTPPKAVDPTNQGANMEVFGCRMSETDRRAFDEHFESRRQVEMRVKAQQEHCGIHPKQYQEMTTRAVPGPQLLPGHQEQLALQSQRQQVALPPTPQTKPMVMKQGITEPPVRKMPSLQPYPKMSPKSSRSQLPERGGHLPMPPPPTFAETEARRQEMELQHHQQQQLNRQHQQAMNMMSHVNARQIGPPRDPVANSRGTHHPQTGSRTPQHSPRLMHVPAMSSMSQPEISMYNPIQSMSPAIRAAVTPMHHQMLPQGTRHSMMPCKINNPRMPSVPISDAAALQQAQMVHMNQAQAQMQQQRAAAEMVRLQAMHSGNVVLPGHPAHNPGFPDAKNYQPELPVQPQMRDMRTPYPATSVSHSNGLGHQLKKKNEPEVKKILNDIYGIFKEKEQQILNSKTHKSTEHLSQVPSDMMAQGPDPPAYHQRHASEPNILINQHMPQKQQFFSNIPRPGEQQMMHGKPGIEHGIQRHQMANTAQLHERRRSMPALTSGIGQEHSRMAYLLAQREHERQAIMVHQPTSQTGISPNSVAWETIPETSRALSTPSVNAVANMSPHGNSFPGMQHPQSTMQTGPRCMQKPRRRASTVKLTTPPSEVIVLDDDASTNANTKAQTILEQQHKLLQQQLQQQQLQHLQQQHQQQGQAVNLQSYVVAEIEDSESYSCVLCNKEASFLCSGCKKAWYCSPKCQMKAWDKHSTECK